MSDDIREAVKRINAGNFHEEDFRAIASAIRSQQLRLVEQQTTGQRAISIEGGAEDSNIFTGDHNQNQINNANTYNYGITREELRVILQELKSFDSKTSFTESQKVELLPDSEPLVLSINSDIFNQINAHLLTIEELHQSGQLPETEQDNLKQLRVEIHSIKEIEQKLNDLADNANQILQNSIKYLKRKLRNLETDSEDSLCEARSQICLQEQIDMLENFQNQLRNGKVVARWLDIEITKGRLAERLSEFALDAHPKIRESSSPQQLEEFKFSIEDFLESLSHCLVWGRTKILDDPDTPIVFDSEIYIATFEHLKTFIPDRLPHNGRDHLQEYIDYLIRNLPTYQRLHFDNY